MNILFMLKPCEMCYHFPSMYSACQASRGINETYQLSHKKIFKKWFAIRRHNLSNCCVFNRAHVISFYEQLYYM